MARGVLVISIFKEIKSDFFKKVLFCKWVAKHDWHVTSYCCGSWLQNTYETDGKMSGSGHKFPVSVNLCFFCEVSCDVGLTYSFVLHL